MMLRKLSAIVLVSSLAFSSILCAPSQQQQASSLKTTSSSQQMTAPTTTTASATLSSSSKSTSPTTTTVSPSKSSTSANNLASSASIQSGSPSLVNFKNVANIETGVNSNMDSFDTFDGKNPFADDSLWQIPVHLVRDLSDNQNQESHSDKRDSMAKSETRSAALDENDDDEMDSLDNPSSPSQANVPQSSSSAPTVISASTDLKTSAGYNHYNNHHYGGHHYQPKHYHGKYFQ